MKACMSPRESAPDARGTHDDSYHHVVQVGQELHGRLDRARKELRTEARLVQRLVLAVELLYGGLAPPECLHES